MFVELSYPGRTGTIVVDASYVQIYLDAGWVYVGETPPEPSQFDEDVAALVEDADSETRAALTDTFASLDDDGQLVIGGEPVEVGGGYAPPEGGIPRADLAGAVQTSLDRAETAFLRTSTRDFSTSVYLPTERALDRARAGIARARAGGADFKIRCTGDSITAGQGSTAATNPATGTSYPARMRQALDAAGRFGTIRTGPVYFTDANNAQGTRDSRVTSIGSGWNPGVDGYVRSGLTGTAPSGLIRITPDQNVDTFVITYAQYAATGNLTFSIDGAAATTQSFNGSSAVGVKTITTTLGAHTLDIGATGAEALVYMVDAYDSTQVGGTRIARVGTPGVSLSQVVPNMGYGGVSAGWAGWTPDVEIIHLGTNDAFAGWNPTTYAANLTTLIAWARGATADPVILVPIPAGPAYGGANHAALVAACYAVADATGCALVDLDARWASDAASRNAAPYQYLNGDLTHPTNRGYADMGAAVSNALLSLL